MIDRIKTTEFDLHKYDVTVRGKQVQAVYDTYKNVLVSPQLFRKACEEIDTSIPISWIRKYIEFVREDDIDHRETWDSSYVLEEMIKYAIAELRLEGENNG